MLNAFKQNKNLQKSLPPVCGDAPSSSIVQALSSKQRTHETTYKENGRDKDDRDSMKKNPMHT